MLQWWADLRSGVSDWNECLCSSTGMTKGPPQNANCSFWNVLLGYGPTGRQNLRSIAFLQLYTLDVMSNFFWMWWSCAAWICMCVFLSACVHVQTVSLHVHTTPQPGVCWDLNPSSGHLRLCEKESITSASCLITVSHHQPNRCSQLREVLRADLEQTVKMLQHQVCMWSQWSTEPCSTLPHSSRLHFAVHKAVLTHFLFFFISNFFRWSGRFAHVSSAELLAVNPSRWSSPTSCCTSPFSSISWFFSSLLQVSQPKIDQPCIYKSARYSDSPTFYRSLCTGPQINDLN